MQNPYIKYIKTKQGYFSLFYTEQGNLFCRSFSHEGWSTPQKIAEQTAPAFSLTQYGEQVYLLYSDTEGQLTLAVTKDLLHWEKYPPLQIKEGREQTKFFLLPTEDALHLIYHLPTESTGIDALVYTAFRKGVWEKPYRIDRFLPMPKTPFLARRLSREHLILYYRTGRNILSAREMLLHPYTMGSVTPLIQTPAPFTDVSIVNDAERIHILYIVRGVFRTQVVYQYKHTSAISTPRILWEDSNCDHCLIYLEKGKVISMWTVNGQPMRCVSENGGTSFGPPERYMGQFPSHCLKGELLGAEDTLLNASECYGNPQNGFSPAVFAPTPMPAPKPQQPTAPSPSYTALQETHQKELEEMTALLAQRSDEVAAVNARWRIQTERLEQELASLRKENEALMQQLSAQTKDTPQPT